MPEKKQYPHRLLNRYKTYPASFFVAMAKPPPLIGICWYLQIFALNIGISYRFVSMQH